MFKGTLAIPVMTVLTDLMNVNKKMYCTVSIKTLQKCVADWYGVPYSERTIRRHLKWAVDTGLIKRTARKKKLENGRIISRPNLYQLCGNSMRLVHRFLRKGLRLVNSTGRTFSAPKYLSYDDSYSNIPRQSQKGGRWIGPNELFVPGSGTLKLI